MKIGLLTFYWADDCGAMLQALALKYVLEKSGGQTEVIPYAPLRLVGRYWWCPLLAAARPEGGLRYRFNWPAWRRNVKLGWKFWARRYAMHAFRRRYLSAEKPVRTVKKLCASGCDRIVVGSDQVWNPAITVGLDDAYIGNFERKKECRLIAYAASMGSSALPEADRAAFARSVSRNFFAISTREPSAVPFLERLLHREVTDLADPVLLLRREDWKRLARLPREEDYILLHWTEYNQDMARYAAALARQLRKKLVQTSFPVWRGMEGTVRCCAGGGPAEFLGYIQKAACVVTNSFHATAFSVLFEKDFVVFGHSAYQARLAGLLDRTGLSGHMWNSEWPSDPTGIWRAADWSAVREHLETERGRGEQFLRGSLERGEGLQ